MLVILKLVTSVLSAALRVMTRPEVVWVFTLVVAFVTDGVSAIALTVMVAVARPPPNPAAVLSSEACAWKLKVVDGLNRFALGGNFNPFKPWVTVMKSPLLIGVVPLLWNRVPLVMPVILKFVTSAPSPALRVMTRPEVVCVSSFVVAFVTDGVSATGVTLKTTVACTALFFGSAAPFVVPLSWIVYRKLAAPLKFAAGVNSTLLP